MTAIPKPTRKPKAPPKRIKTRRPVKRQSPRPSAVARRKADKAWSLAVRERPGHVCERCQGKATDAHHVFGRKAHAGLRGNLFNGVALCRACHQYAHSHPVRFRLEFSLFRPGSWRVLRSLLAPVEAK